MKFRLRAQVRYMACLVAVAAFYALQSGTVTRAAMIDDCEQICDPSVPCEEQCWGPVEGQGLPLLITCGDYEGGVAGGMCDGCDMVCGPGTECERECWDDGLSDCGEFEECVDCGDGFCAMGLETRLTCDEDCNDPMPSCSCGDSTCNLQCGERYDNCSSDCPPPGASGFCGDFTCDDTDGETVQNCPDDCSVLTQPCSQCPWNWVCANNVCLAPADIYVLPTCYAGQEQCACGFVCTVTQYLDSSGQRLTVCIPDWNKIFHPSDPCDYLPGGG